jgi:hypothetical protein
VAPCRPPAALSAQHDRFLPAEPPVRRSGVPPRRSPSPGVDEPFRAALLRARSSGGHRPPLPVPRRAEHRPAPRSRAVPGVAVHSCGPSEGCPLPRSKAVATGIGTVTTVDTSRSCPQTCAQVGEISCASAHPGSSEPDRTAGTSPALASSAAPYPSLTCVDAPNRADGPAAADRSPRTPVLLRTRPGDRAGRRRGQGVDGAGRRCTTVEMSTCRQQEGAHRPQSANRAIRALTSGKRLDPQLPHV